MLAASTRNARPVRELALVGADISTVPFYVLEEMVRHPKTYQGAEQFRRDVVKEYAALLKTSAES